MVFNLSLHRSALISATKTWLVSLLINIACNDNSSQGKQQEKCSVYEYLIWLKGTFSNVFQLIKDSSYYNLMAKYLVHRTIKYILLFALACEYIFRTHRRDVYTTTSVNSYGIKAEASLLLSAPFVFGCIRSKSTSKNKTTGNCT